jgi:hypothetical protein
MILSKKFLAALSILAVPVLTGANSDGCGGDVVVGSDTCVRTGCSGQICAAEDQASTCEWSEEYACYQQFGVCGRDDNNECGWEPTQELQDCLDGVQNPPPCVVTGCSGQLCEEEDTASTCEWTDAYACYQTIGVCERDAQGQCGWQQSPELLACLGQDSCTTPNDCVFPEICQVCGNGECAVGSCVNGACELTCPDTTTCTAPTDCVFDASCHDCGDGTCATGDCVNGQCALVCPDQPSSDCTSVDECVFPEICQDCGNGVCAGGACIDGRCELVCPQ